MQTEPRTFDPVDNNQALYFAIINAFFKKEVRECSLDAVEHMYDPSINEGNCDELLSAESHSDGTILFDYENMAYVLWDAIESGKRFGAMIDKSCQDASTDPKRPFLTHHSKMCIPIKEIV